MKVAIEICRIGLTSSMYHDIDEDNNVLPGAHEVRERL